MFSVIAELDAEFKFIPAIAAKVPKLLLERLSPFSVDSLTVVVYSFGMLIATMIPTMEAMKDTFYIVLLCHESFCAISFKLISCSS